MSEEIKVVSKNKINKKLLFSVAALLAIALVAVLIAFVPKAATAKRLEEQLSLGDKYLSELKYEQAVAAYLAAIEIDPKNVDAYLGLADAYIAQGEYEKAEEILEDALDEIDDEEDKAGAEINKKLEEIETVRKQNEIVETPVPTATSTPKPTATSTPVPAATSAPEPTATSTPVPTATSTPTPEPTATSTPEPTVTSTPMPTATSTPDPTVTSTPTPMPTATPVAEIITTPGIVYKPENGFLVLDGLNFIAANDGVILTSKENQDGTVLYGAVDYEGKVLVTNKYSSYCEICDGGYFALYDNVSDMAYVFNKYGEIMLELKDPQQLRISEGIVTYTQDYTLNVYDLKEQKMLLIEELGFSQAVRVRNGVFYGLHYYERILFKYKIEKDGIEKNVLDIKESYSSGDYWDSAFVYPSASGLVNGYAPVYFYGGSETNRAGLMNGDYNELLLFDIQEFYAHIGASENATFSYLNGADANGDYTNVGKLLVVKVSDGDKETAYLLDFSKAKYKTVKTDIYVDELSFTYEENLVSNIDEVVVASHEKIYINDCGYYLASDGDTWFFIDNTGKKVAEYVDASEFRGGYAAVIDEEGMAYLVDTNFEKITESYPADRVSVAGDGFCFEADGKERILLLDYEEQEIPHSTFVSHDYLFYEINEDNEIIITGLKDKNQKEIVIPEQIGNLPVTKIGERVFSYCTSIEKVVISEGVEEIESWLYLDGIWEPRETMGCFEGCTSLKEVIFPSTLKKLGCYTFYGCSSLEKIDLPDDIECIAVGTFTYCTNLTEINLPEKLVTIGISDDSEGGWFGDGAFEGCSSLKKVVIPDNVTEIGDSTFYGCTNLEEIELPEGVKEIGAWAFTGCKSLNSIFIPGSITYLEKRLPVFPSGWNSSWSSNSKRFWECENLQEIIVDEANQYYSSVDGVLFNRDKSFLLGVPDGYKEENYVVPDGVILIADGAFYNCVNLKTIVVPDSVKEIKDDAFEGCTNLTNVIFAGDNELYYFEEGAIYERIINRYGEHIGTRLFKVIDMGIGEFYIDADITSISSYAFDGLENLHTIYVAAGNEDYESKDGVLFYSGMTSIVKIPEGYRNTVFEIPEEIEDDYLYGVFYGCKNITKIVLNKSITSFPNGIMNTENLKEIYIPETVTEGMYYYDYEEKWSKITIITPAGSYAEQFAIENGIPYQIQ